MINLNTYMEKLKSENIIDFSILNVNNDDIFDLSSHPRQQLIGNFEKNITSIKDRIEEFNNQLQIYNIEHVKLNLEQLSTAYKKLPDTDISTGIKSELIKIFKVYLENFNERHIQNSIRQYTVKNISHKAFNTDTVWVSHPKKEIKNGIISTLQKQFTDVISDKITTEKTIPQLVDILIPENFHNMLLNTPAEYTITLNSGDGPIQIGFKQFFKLFRDLKSDSDSEYNGFNSNSYYYKQKENVLTLLNQNVDSVKQEVRDIVNRMNQNINNQRKSEIINTLNEKLANYNAIKNLDNKNNFMENMKEFIDKKVNDVAFMKYINKECSERSAEGKFINSELASLRANIVKSVMNKKKDSTFTSDINNFSEECFNYYCHNTKVCFTNPSMKNNSNANSYMIEELDKINAGKISDKLNYCVFTVFNITKDAEQDPPKIPYTDLTMIKMILSKLELETMNFKFSTDRDDPQNKFTLADYESKLNTMGTEEIINEKIQKFNDELNVLINLDEKKYTNLVFMNPEELIDINEETFQIYTKDPKKYTIKQYLIEFINDVRKIFEIKSYELSLGDDGKTVLQIINLLEKVLNGFFIEKYSIQTQNMFLSYLKYLLNFIVKEISMINNLTYLGTLDFTQNMRNGGIVDLTCNRFYIPTINKNIFDVTSTDTIAAYKEMVTKVKYDTMNSSINKIHKSSRGGNRKKLLKGGQQKQIDISRLDISVNDNYRQRLNNTIFYNIFKFMRWSYYKKHDNMENIDSYIFKDYLMTIIVCVILHSMHQNKLAIGVFVDQILSMGMYYKYKNEKFLLLPYYLPFV